jgi:multiple sugar transport system substrate-binding protein
MHRHLRWTMGLVALMMIGVLLAACGGTTPAVQPTAAAPAAEPTTAAPAAEPTAAPAAEPTAAPAAEPTAAPAAEPTAAPTGGTGGNLQIIWFAWQPCQALGELVKTYPDATVEVRCVPIGQWHDQIFTDFAAQGGADLVILDSQFIGEAVIGNHIVELTDWMPDNIETEDYVPEALSAYGEYPAASKRYYGVAIEGDVQMLVYRKDLFENADIQAAYKTATGQDLKLPETWTELLAIAKFFKETPDDVDQVPNGYTTFWCGTPACYDQVATVWNQMAWSFGGELWDPATYKVEGVINSEANLKALEFAAQLFQTGPDGSGDFQFNETVSALCDGSVAMGTIWFGFGPSFVDTQGCSQSANLGYGLIPGETERFLSLGGMGISVSSYSKNQDASLAFLKWLQSKETQIEWAKLGGFSARKSVLDSDEFKNAAPYNPAFSEAYQYVKDFWNVPEYNRLLQIQMEQLNLAITGQADPKTALDTIAAEQQAIFDEAYPNGPPQ